MEASTVAHEHALRSSKAIEIDPAQRGADWPLALLFIGVVLTMYLASGYAIYALVAALT